METIATKKNETKKEVKEVKKNVPNYLDMIRLYGATYTATYLNSL